MRTYTYKAVPCRPGRLRTPTWWYINIWNLPPEYSVTSFFTTLLLTNHIPLCKDSYPLLPYQVVVVVVVVDINYLSASSINRVDGSLTNLAATITSYCF